MHLVFQIHRLFFVLDILRLYWWRAQMWTEGPTDLSISKGLLWTCLETTLTVSALYFSFLSQTESCWSPRWSQTQGSPASASQELAFKVCFLSCNLAFAQKKKHLHKPSAGFFFLALKVTGCLHIPREEMEAERAEIKQANTLQGRGCGPHLTFYPTALVFIIQYSIWISFASVEHPHALDSPRRSDYT